MYWGWWKGTVLQLLDTVWVPGTSSVIGVLAAAGAWARTAGGSSSSRSSSDDESSSINDWSRKKCSSWSASRSASDAGNPKTSFTADNLDAIVLLSFRLQTNKKQRRCNKKSCLREQSYDLENRLPWKITIITLRSIFAERWPKVIDNQEEGTDDVRWWRHRVSTSKHRKPFETCF